MAGRIERSSAWDGGQDDATSTSQVEPQSILGIGRLEGHYGDPKAGFASPWPWAGAGGIRRSQRIRCTLSQSVQILRNSTQNPRSVFESRGRFTERRRTASCWRRATFSRASSRRALKAEMRAGTNDEIMPAWCWQTGD